MIVPFHDITFFCIFFHFVVMTFTLGSIGVMLTLKNVGIFLCVLVKLEENFFVSNQPMFCQWFVKIFLKKKKCVIMVKTHPVDMRQGAVSETRIVLCNALGTGKLILTVLRLGNKSTSCHVTCQKTSVFLRFLKMKL